MAKQYIQVGVTALRDPVTHDFLPSVPLYIEADEGETEQSAASEMAQQIAPLFVDMMKQYVQGCKKLGGIQ